MTISAHRRHDISDHVWAILENSLPGRKGQWGREAKDNRLFINAVFGIFHTGGTMTRFTSRLWRLEKYTS